MSLITGSIKSIISIRIKHRHDSYTDQVSRIFVAKMFMVSSLVIGVDWFHDTVFCILPKNSDMSEDFVQSACWILGFYIYPQMEEHMHESAYYGIPQYVDVDGFWNGTKHLCRTVEPYYKSNDKCIPMEKHYFAHYQWMPFYIASLAVIFYLPYVMFRIVNTDIISLQYHLKHAEIHTKDIVENYFNHKINSKTKMRFRILFNFLIKLMYLGVNVFAFKVLDIILNNQFYNYGIHWTKFLAYNSSMRMDFQKRQTPSPGNKMLPTFGYCNIHELSMDGISAVDNKNKILCEISSNVLYQYVMMVLWFVLVFAIVASICGILLNIFGHLLTVTYHIKRDKTSQYVYRYLTLRECEYLDYIRHKNLVVFGNVVRCILARNSLLKDLIPRHFGNRDVTDGLAKEDIAEIANNQINVPIEEPPQTSPGELKYFRKTEHQMQKMGFQERVKHEKQYGLLDNLLSGAL